MGFLSVVAEQLGLGPFAKPARSEFQDAGAARRKKLTEENLRRKQRGRTTLLTGGEGVTARARVRRKSLLGE